MDLNDDYNLKIMQLKQKNINYMDELDELKLLQQNLHSKRKKINSYIGNLITDSEIEYQRDVLNNINTDIKDIKNKIEKLKEEYEQNNNNIKKYEEELRKLCYEKYKEEYKNFKNSVYNDYLCINEKYKQCKNKIEDENISDEEYGKHSILFLHCLYFSFIHK